MNCKPGDLAVMVRSTAGNEGKIVRCVRMVGPLRKFGPDMVTVRVESNWETDPPVIGWAGDVVAVRDAWLRPIRPQPDDAVDETLLWLPVPTNIPVKGTA